MTRARHLPPMVRSRPPGLLGFAHDGVEATKTGARASAWRRANDPDVALRRRALWTAAAAGSVLSPAAATGDVDRQPTGATPS